MDIIKHEYASSFDINNSVVGVLSGGLGNKIFLIFEHLYIFKLLKKLKPDLKLYFINQRSHHERGDKFNFDLLFEKHKDFSFINWYILDKYKRDIKQIISEQPDPSIKFSDKFISELKTPLMLDYILKKIPDFKQSIIDSFEIIVKQPKIKFSTNNGLGVHIRYGDKLHGAIKDPDSFLLANPIWYINAINIMRKKDENVIFYTDSPKIVKEFILPYIEKPYIISDSSVEETFKEMTTIPKLILTDSTLPLSAFPLRKKPASILIPTYNFEVSFPNNLFEYPKFIKVQTLPLEQISKFSIIQLQNYI